MAATAPALQVFLEWSQATFPIRLCFIIPRLENEFNTPITNNLEHGIVSDISVQDIPDKGLGFITNREVDRDNSIVVFIPSKLLLNATQVRKYAKEKAPKLEETFQALHNNGRMLNERLILMCFLLHERIGSNDSPSLWKAYVDILPRTLHTPLFYDYTLRACLNGTSLEAAIDAKIKKLQREYNTLRPYFNRWSTQGINNNFNDGHDVITFEHYRWADGVFWSRILSFGSRFEDISTESNLLNSNIDDYHLVPYLDFANHSLTPCSRWELTIEGEGIELILTKPDTPEQISPGTEICISYGDKPNSELLFVHGFTLSDNPWSAISFPVPFFDDDELVKIKMNFMQFHGIKHLVSVTRKKGGAELTQDSTRAMWISVLTEDDGLKFTQSSDSENCVELIIGDKVISTLEDLDNVINGLDFYPIIEWRVVDSVLDNVENLLSYLKQANEKVLKMMENERNSRELEYIRIYREDEHRFLEYAVEDFTRKRESLMSDEIVQRFIDY
ncbi:5065_t:CDS:2 [Diversispora eburnea]|uniref:5065_t:CDS:1 n=1 Tax=Diversispora eburnea TaxID=1213867 RepID=A0A9N9FBV7_9GLOM|nr:5065_t:CDS:2 [Diversispora eburnea]